MDTRICSKIKSLLSWVIILLVAFFFAKIFFDSWQAAKDSALSLNFFDLFIATVFIGASFMTLAFNWFINLRFHKVSIGFWQSMNSFFKAQILRYIPGNVWTFAGRYYFNKNDKVPTEIITFSLIVEILMMLITGFIIILLSIGSLMISGFFYLALSLAIISAFVLIWTPLFSVIVSKILRRKIEISLTPPQLFFIFFIFEQMRVSMEKAKKL